MNQRWQYFEAWWDDRGLPIFLGALAAILLLVVAVVAALQ